MKNTVKIVFLSGVLSALAACTTAGMKVSTFPEQAEVWARPIGEERARLIGLTPITVKSEDLLINADGQESFAFQLRKVGYKPEDFYVTDINRVVSIEITKKMTPEVAWRDAVFLNRVIESLFEVRSLSEAKKYEEALHLLSVLKKDFPNLAAIYELEGGVYILQGKYANALDSYTKASDFNPQNATLQETVRQLERLQGLAPRVRLKDLNRLPAVNVEEPEASQNEKPTDKPTDKNENKPADKPAGGKSKAEGAKAAAASLEEAK